MTTDAWGIDDGWFDFADRWQPASPDTIEAIRAAMGDPSPGRGVQVVRPGSGDAHVDSQPGAVVEYQDQR